MVIVFLVSSVLCFIDYVLPLVGFCFVFLLFIY